MAPEANGTVTPRRLDHGVIGNGRVLALVAPDTGLEWLCLPRFDSPSVFGALLDPDKGGIFRLDSPGGGAKYDMAYVRNTNVLRTRITASDGVFDLIDFAPRLPSGLTVEAPLEIHRLLLPVEGAPRVRVRFFPRPDYGRAPGDLVQTRGAIEVVGGPDRLFLRTNVAESYLGGSLALSLDEPKYFAFSCGEPSLADSAASVQRALDLTIAGWRAWVRSCAVPAFADEAVLRSALCLKLHAYLDTGAIIASATTSIPEALGTERTWDYRYCWLRDAAFVVEALRRLSHLTEGEAFVRFLRDVAQEGPLQPVFGIGGERNLPEVHLPHLAGFAGCGPVRVGNAAYLQAQHDLMGEMVVCLETLLTDPRVVSEDATIFALIERLVNEAIRLAPAEDTGIWELRTVLRHHTLSKVFCWVAANRGVGLARLFGRFDLAERWEAWAHSHREAVLKEGFNQEKGYFTQILGGEHPDASLLLLPMLGFVEARDPRFVSTVRACERQLVDRGLMLRYRNADDFGETTSAFLVCSFWWAEALAMMGELDSAIQVFDRVSACANPLGLFSEDADPRTGRLLGNFPQTFTHVGLIHTANTIGELLDARDRRFRVWT